MDGVLPLRETRFDLFHEASARSTGAGCWWARVESRLRELLTEKAADIGVVICKMEIMPDHLRLFVKTNPGNAPHYIVQQFKGYTSRVMRQEFKGCANIPTLWTRSYYLETIGHISEDDSASGL